MPEIIFQNSDNPETNPIASNQLQNDQKKINFSRPSPKILALIVLFSLVFLLFIVSLFINQKNVPTQTSPTPTPIPVAKVTPQAQLPTQYIKQFEQIDELLNQQDILLPPSLDQNLGL